MADDSFFAPPPFKPAEALLRLKRELRDAGLSERDGRFERKGLALVKAVLADDGSTLSVAIVKQPSRNSPEWQDKRLGDGAQVRDFVALVKQRIAAWNDRDD